MRRLRRFFVSGKISSKGETITLSVRETYHLKKIIRLKEGDSCLVADGQGSEAEAEILRFNADQTVSLKILNQPDFRPIVAGHSPVKIHAFQALLQKGKQDFLIEKSQELLVDRVAFVHTERSQVKIASVKKVQVLSRWQKICQGALKQSGGTRLTQAALYDGLQNALSDLPNEGVCVVFHPSPEAVPFSDWIDGFKREGFPDKTVSLFFGPEGGFAPKELKVIAEGAQEKNLTLDLVSLGTVIWKAETAFLGVIAALRLMAGGEDR